jgi:flagellar hook protein FlgE
VPVNLAFSGGVTSPTTAGELSIQLNADAANGDQFSRTLRIYDSLGAAHDMNIQFTKTGVGAWDMEVFDDATPPVSLGVTALTFDGTGQLTAPLPPSVNVTTGAWPNGADPTIFDIDISGMTQYSGDFEVILAGQNGAALGQRSSVGVDERGFVTATFTNGQTRRLYQLPLATFPKVDGLELRTGNAYSQTRDSGEYILNIAGAGGTGRMSSQALEQSNVDLAEEFSRMIVTQRAYSASTKVITTSDQMLAELMNLR